ncbi:hypothetical protein KRMM14A1259_42470 [Krasilnikovia sp. MM14-A1259]
MSGAPGMPRQTDASVSRGGTQALVSRLAGAGIVAAIDVSLLSTSGSGVTRTRRVEA